MKHKLRSAAEERQRSNPYHPMTYREWRDSVLIAAYELNEMVRGIPPNLIAELWLYDCNFRGRFKALARAAALIHYEREVQSLMPWLCVDLLEYCKRFSEPGYNISKKYSPNTLTQPE